MYPWWQAIYNHGDKTTYIPVVMSNIRRENNSEKNKNSNKKKKKSSIQTVVTKEYKG